MNGRPNGWGEIHESDAISLIHTALDNGIRFFDTAVGYGLGKSEVLLGKAFESHPKGTEAIVCTKVPLSKSEISSKSLGVNFRTHVESSLKRLNKNQIDILLIHNPPDEIDWANFDVQALTKLKQEGKIVTFGVSSKSLIGVQNVLNSEFGTCLEWSFNLLERRPKDLFRILEMKKMNFIARSPLSRGFLTSKHIQRRVTFEFDDFRSTLPTSWINWIQYSLSEMNLSKEEEQNLSRIALEYCLSFSAVSVVIPGITKSHHLKNYLEIQNRTFLTENFLIRLESKTDSCFPDWKHT